MQKAGRLTIVILVLTFCLGLSNGLLAQRDTIGFNWKLIEVTDPTIPAKIEFTPKPPIIQLDTAEFTSWDFGDGTTSTTPIETHTYATLNPYDVDINFTLNSVASTITRRVIAKASAFFVTLDPNTNVTYTRILLSAFRFPTNDITTHGGMRFEWSVDGVILTDANYQFPNIRYTFESSGIHNVTLSAWNIADPTKISSHTIPINIIPDFSTKVKFPNIPNVFTPNNSDLDNDRFIVQTSGLSRLVFKVFTRTGVLIYQNEAYYINWDGKNDNGKDVPEGIYYYIIEDLDKQYETAKGFVYIFNGK